MDTQTREFKVLLVGDGGCGKTSYMKRHLTGEFERKYISTIGCEIKPIQFETSEGTIRLNMVDTAGQEKFSGNQEQYYIQSDAAIIMFDVTSRCSFKNLNGWIDTVKQYCPSIPIVICGNKVDEKDRKIKPTEISQYLRELKIINPNIQYYDISAKTNYNFEKPFLSVIRTLTENLNLRLLESPAKIPVEIELDPDFQQLELSYRDNELATLLNSLNIDDEEEVMNEIFSNFEINPFPSVQNELGKSMGSFL